MSTTEFNSIEIAPKNISSSPKHRAEARNNILAKVLVAGLVLSGVSLVPQFTQQVPSAQAGVPADSIALYLSAPMVQGPTVTGSNVFMETFDAVYTDTNARLNCPSSSPVYSSIEQSTDGNATDSQGPFASCGVYNPYFHHWGGATTTSSTPTFSLTNERTMSSFAHTWSDKPFTLTLTRAASYVGFWWTAGSNGNVVRFFDQSDQLITSFATSEVLNRLGSTGDSTVTNSDNTNTPYKKKYYIGHPEGHVSQTPTLTSARPATVPNNNTWDTEGAYAFLNLYVGGSVRVAKIVFDGGGSSGGSGFEFDNLTISTDTQTPAASMVKVAEKVSLAPLVVAPPSGGGGGVSSFVPIAEVKLDPCVKVSTAAVNRKSRAFSGFGINSAVLTPAMKRQIRTWLNKHPEEVCVSVAGFTMGPRVLPTDPKLARDRARAVRAYIKSIRPEASFTDITSRTQRLVGDDIRRATVTLRF